MLDILLGWLDSQHGKWNEHQPFHQLAQPSLGPYLASLRPSMSAIVLLYQCYHSFCRQFDVDKIN